MRAETPLPCPPVLDADPIADRSHTAPTTRSPRRSSILVARDGALWEELGPDRKLRRLVRLPDDVVSIAASRTSDLVAVAAPSHTPAVMLYAPTRSGYRALGGGVESYRAPSRVSLGDVDGDGRIEALVLVTGRARFDPRLALRPFVYGWDGHRLYPKWLGSRLSRPFDDATLGDLDGDGRDELVAIEHTREGAFELAAYRWRGFGFERIATSDTLAFACGVSVDERGHVLARVDDAVIAFTLKAGHLDRLSTRSD